MVKQKNPRSELLEPKDFKAAIMFSDRNAGASVTISVTNFTRRPITLLSEANEGTDVPCQTGDEGLRDKVVIVIKVLGRRGTVNINASPDNYAEMSFGLYDVVKGHCELGWERCGHYQYDTEGYQMAFTISSGSFTELNRIIEIPGLGMKVADSKISARQDPFEMIEDETGYRSNEISGMVFRAKDRSAFVRNLFYASGNKVTNVVIDRRSTEADGVYLHHYGKISDNRRRIAAMEYFTLEEALSGDNPYGIKFHTSQEDVLKEIKELQAAKKLIQPEKDEDKEKKAKLASAWIKAGGEFIKNILPTIAKGVKWLISFIAKKAFLAAVVV